MKKFIFKFHLHIQKPITNLKLSKFLNKNIIGTKSNFTIINTNQISIQINKLIQIIASILQNNGNILIITPSPLEKLSFPKHFNVNIKHVWNPGYLFNKTKKIPELIIFFNPNIPNNKLQYVINEANKLSTPFILIDQSSFNPNNTTYHLNLNTSSPKISYFLEIIIKKAYLISTLNKSKKFI